MTNDLRFDLSCREDAWVGAGRWRSADGVLRLRFEVLARGGKRLKGREVALPVEGRGNALRFAFGEWRRVW